MSVVEGLCLYCLKRTREITFDSSLDEYLLFNIQFAYQKGYRRLSCSQND